MSRVRQWSHVADTCSEREGPIQTRAGAWPDRPKKQIRASSMLLDLTRACLPCQHVSRAGPASQAGHVRETRVSWGRGASDQSEASSLGPLSQSEGLRGSLSLGGTLPRSVVHVTNSEIIPIIENILDPKDCFSVDKIWKLWMGPSAKCKALKCTN